MAAKILVVDDERPVLELLIEMLEDRGYEVEGVGDGGKALEKIAMTTYDLVVCDLIMPGMSGLEVIRKVKDIDEETEIIVLTGYATIDNAVQALRNHKAFDFLTKPLDNLDALYNTIEKALERRDLQKENQSLIRALKKANDELERRVEARTQELNEANKVMVKELTERKRTEAELRRAKETAEVASRVKSDFLANMSHELKNPLNSILGFSQVLMEKYFGPLTEKQEQYVKDIHQSGQHLLMLINDILDLTSLDNEKKELALSDVNLCDMIESSLNFVRQKALKQGIDLEVEIDDEARDLIARIDKRKIKQVLFNLLSNAMKFTPDGGEVKVEARKRSESGADFVEVSVSDTGIGIEKQYQEHIFEEFFQINSSKENKTPGPGLGLSLAKRIVEMHGGTIAAESEGENKGSRFTFALPVGPLA